MAAATVVCLIPVAVMVGGSALRFPINKLLYPLRGRPLIQHVLDRLRWCRHISSVTLIASPFSAHLFKDLGVDIVVDSLCLGPLSGVYTALRLYGRVFAVGGDMPKVGCGYIERMLSVCEERYQACIPVWRAGYMEPLAAVYSNGLLHVFEQGIAVGEYSIQRLVRSIRPEVQLVSIEDHLAEFVDEFTNVNTIDDMHRLAERL